MNVSPASPPSRTPGVSEPTGPSRTSLMCVSPCPGSRMAWWCCRASAGPGGPRRRRRVGQVGEDGLPGFVGVEGAGAVGVAGDGARERVDVVDRGAVGGEGDAV